jgi:hypothetical protein
MPVGKGPRLGEPGLSQRPKPDGLATSHVALCCFNDIPLTLALPPGSLPSFPEPGGVLV